MRIYHNMASMNLYRKYKDNLSSQAITHGRISSGFRVQYSKDDPNAMAESQKLKLQIRGLQMSTRNIQDGISMIQTADGAMQNINESLLRVREIIIQAGGAANPEDKKVIDMEVKQMIEHIDTVSNNTETNKVKLLAKENIGKENPIVQVGAMVGEKLEIPFLDLSAEGLEVNKVGSDNISDSLDKLDIAISKVNNYRGKYAAIASRMETTYNNGCDMSIRIEASEAEITGADIAYEMMEYTKESLLLNSGIAMMTQSNKFPQDILRILENIKAK